MQCDLSLSIRSNIEVRSFSNILQISSRKNIVKDRPAKNNIEDRSNEQCEDTILEAVMGANREDHVDYTNDVGLSFVAAGIIEQRILRSGVSCGPCMRVLD